MKRIVLMAMMLILFSGIKSNAKTVIIGESEPLTGRFAKLGIAVHEGIEYAVKEVNAHGGVNGIKVKLISLNDQGRSYIAAANAKKLIKEGAVGIVGGYVDSSVRPIAKAAERAKIPYIASASLDRRLTKLSYHYFFRISNMNGFTKPILLFMKEFTSLKVALLYPGTPGTAQLSRALKKGLNKEGIRVAMVGRFKMGTHYFEALLSNMKQKKINFVISLGCLPDNILLVKQIRASRLELLGFLGAFGVDSHFFSQELGKLSEGIIGTTAWDQDITYPGTEKFSNYYKITFKMIFGHRPDPLTMHGYAAARTLMEAMRAVKKGLSLTGKRIRDKIATIKLKLPLEALSFTKNGEPKNYRRVIFQIIDGKHVPLLRYPLYPLYKMQK